MRAISEGKVNLKWSISEEGLNSTYRPPLGVYCYLQKLVIQERKNYTDGKNFDLTSVTFTEFLF